MDTKYLEVKATERYNKQKYKQTKQSENLIKATPMVDLTSGFTATL